MYTSVIAKSGNVVSKSLRCISSSIFNDNENDNNDNNENIDSNK